MFWRTIKDLRHYHFRDCYRIYRIKFKEDKRDLYCAIIQGEERCLKFPIFLACSCDLTHIFNTFCLSNNVVCVLYVVFNLNFIVSME
jgi:hypothetical protein